MQDFSEDAFAEQFSEVASAAVQQILRHQDAVKFLLWMREQAPRRFPRFFSGLPDEDAQRAVTTLLGRALWNATNSSSCSRIASSTSAGTWSSTVPETSTSAWFWTAS